VDKGGNDGRRQTVRWRGGSGIVQFEISINLHLVLGAEIHHLLGGSGEHF
jgi:hypothetical protein